MPSWKVKPQASPPIGWDDIAGADEAKDELREVVEFLRDPKRFRALGEILRVECGGDTAAGDTSQMHTKAA